jgi:molybdopterin converting factor small subunit
MADEITIQVELKGLLQRFARPETGTHFSRRLPAGTGVADLLAGLDLPAEWVGLVAVNRRQADREQPLADGDVVQIFPPFLAGG